ncbi:tRNA dihydrouridine(20/20a) synthase DusA [Candidatus Fukatsuia anoeciicola]|uniref:tRNA dihydrouridine(20/20a) synthase DusA n=1 Tax=Candidatus Fukatsuia anoeciicola TaxID=2994492 RepID=UPI003463CF12
MLKQTYPLGRFSVAPMLNWTDRHCRYFHRLLTKQTLLYTEMITTNAIIHGKSNCLKYNKQEHPIVLQLGGHEPLALAYCAKLAEQKGYDKINLNIGCPSNRVQNGRFGACLMAEADLVVNCISAIHDVVSIPITVKTRIGIDQQDSYAFLYEFVQKITDKGKCNTLIIHARNAWLSGLSPKKNREVPLLNYARVYKLKRDFPALHISINGGIKTLAEAVNHLKYVDGVMIGREAYQNPAILTQVDFNLFHSKSPIVNGVSAIEALYPYIEQELSQGTRLSSITRHILGMFQGIPGAHKWRRYLSENAYKSSANIMVIEQALSLVRDRFESN